MTNIDTTAIKTQTDFDAKIEDIVSFIQCRQNHTRAVFNVVEDLFSRFPGDTALKVIVAVMERCEYDLDIWYSPLYRELLGKCQRHLRSTDRRRNLKRIRRDWLRVVDYVRWARFFDVFYGVYRARPVRDEVANAVFRNSNDTTRLRFKDGGLLITGERVELRLIGSTLAKTIPILVQYGFIEFLTNDYDQAVEKGIRVS